MFERFTERARQTVVLAQVEARQMRHSYIGTEHLLLGLLHEETGLGGRVLRSLDVTLDDVRSRALQVIGSGDEEVTAEQIPFTPRAKKVLEMSLREALSMGHNWIGTEHVLLGLVREQEGVAAKILHGDLQITPDAVRTAVIKALSGPGRQQEPPERVEPGRGDAAAEQTRTRLAGALRELAAAADKVGRAAADYLETL